MEALMLLLDSCVVVMMVYMGLHDDAKRSAAQHTSLFRTREPPNRLAVPVLAAAASRDRTPGARD